MTLEPKDPFALFESAALERIQTLTMALLDEGADPAQIALIYLNSTAQLCARTELDNPDCNLESWRSTFEDVYRSERTRLATSR